MVDQVTKAYDLIASLVPRLQAVRTAGGYATEAGRSVLFGPVPQQPGEAYPFIRLHEVDASTEASVANRPTARMRVEFMAEAYAEQTNATLVMFTGHTLIGDLKKALFGDPTRDMNGQAITAQVEGYSVQPPEDGGSTVIARVRGSFSFTDHFNEP